jgi:hypothetical protein
MSSVDADYEIFAANIFMKFSSLQRQWTLLMHLWNIVIKWVYEIWVYLANRYEMEAMS